ncbi:MAG: cobalamin biosynthesis protein, partial [Bauldia sp.]
MIALNHFWILAAAMVLDGVVGDPDFFWRRVPHPVALIGRLISAFDTRLNRRTISPVAARIIGGLGLVVLVAIAAAVGYGLEYAFARIPYGWVGTVVVVAILLAARSLYDHVRAVAVAFGKGGLDAARTAVS